jgi:hypothetical protein
MGPEMPRQEDCASITEIPWWGWILIAAGAAWLFFPYLWIVAAIVIILLLAMLALVALAMLPRRGPKAADPFIRGDLFRHPD